MINEILKFNKEFVANKGYEKFITNKYPDKKIAILSCMDTRLTELLPAALGVKNGDVKMIKNAGGIISHPFGSVIRSLLVAIFELGELFCGPGGLAWGATNADIGLNDYRIVHAWANDYDSDTCNTYRRNICPQDPDSVIWGDVRKLDLDNLPHIDALAFGFPCNDYSVVGEKQYYITKKLNNGNYIVTTVLRDAILKDAISSTGILVQDSLALVVMFNNKSKTNAPTTIPNFIKNLIK